MYSIAQNPVISNSNKWFLQKLCIQAEKRPARHPDRPFSIFLLRCGIRRRIVQVVRDELQLILEHQLQVCHGVPIPGILFYDVTTLFKEPAALQELSDTLYEMYKDKGITKVVGIESRGFIMGPILATRLGAGFVPIRKPGKLPAETIEESYDKEYGKDTVQMHKDAINEDDVVLLHDDLLATGGTMEAACKLVKQMSPKKVYVNFIIELKELHGKDVFGDDVEVESVLSL